MARERKRHAQDGEVPVAPPFDTASSLLQPTGHHTPIRLPLLKATMLPAPQSPQSPQSRKLARIRSCLQTVATLLEANHAYLPIFLRLEHELEGKHPVRAAVTRP